MSADSRIGIVVFSRYDSRRLPGKALRYIGGRTLLGRVLDRVRLVPSAAVVVATSDRDVDDHIAAAAAAEGVSLFRGSTNDVARRAMACAEHFAFDRIVRVSGDSPFIPPELIIRLLAIAGSDETLVTNLFPRTFPPGASVEVMEIGFLRGLLTLPLNAVEREHVTLYAYRNPERFRIINVSAPDGRYGGVNLAVDDSDDLARAERIVTLLGDLASSASLDVVAAAARTVA